MDFSEKSYKNRLTHIIHIRRMWNVLNIRVAMLTDGGRCTGEIKCGIDMAKICI
jgi:hypothetical protein